MRGADFPENPNRLSFGARFGLNFKAAFRNSASVAPGAAVNPGPATGGVDHNYNDGYVRVDSSGPSSGTTWNWGYNNGSQYNQAADTMEFHAVQTGGASASRINATDDPQYGGELIYQRVLGTLPFFPAARWGLEGAFGYTDLDIRDRRSGSGRATVTTDSYPLNGVLPPAPGHRGTFEGPGVLLGDTPTRTTAVDTSRGTSLQKLSGELWSIRLGPFAEWYFAPQWSLGASVGITLAPTSLDYEFSETTTLASGGRFESSGHSSKSELLYGPYVSAMLRYDFNESWGVYIGAQFQSLTDLEQSAGRRTAKLDQDATVYGLLGVTWKF